MAAGSLSLHEPVEALLAGQQIKQLLALGGEVSFPFGHQRWATNQTGLIFDGIADLHPQKFTEGFSPESRHTRSVELALVRTAKHLLQHLIHLGIRAEDLPPLVLSAK